MEANTLQISIIDTRENERVLAVEKTAVESPKILYDGADDKFANLMASTCTFNMLVNTSEEAWFLHLYTGLETRYKVLLEEISDVENPLLLWSGFLLPEQFEEPYEHSNYFVEFVATDGVGRLKSKYLSEWYFTQSISVVEIIHICLWHTGLHQNIFFAPSIDNAGFELNYQDLMIDVGNYKSGNDKKTIYEILNHVVESVGCRLFAYKGAWYVIGFNRLKDVSIECFEYGVDNHLQFEYKGKAVVDRDVLKGEFYKTPTVGMVPPLQQMITNWDHDNKPYLIPEDVVSHYPVNYDSDVDDRTPNYWNLVTNSGVLLFVWLIELDDNFDYNQLNVGTYYNGLLAFKKHTTRVIGPSLFFNGTVSGVEDFDTNYANIEPFFIYGSEDLERYATLKIEWLVNNPIGVTSQDLIDAIKNNEFEDQFFFAITRRDFKGYADEKAEIYLSNFSTPGVPKGSFDFDLSVENDYLKGSLTLEKVAITKSGWYSIRIYPVISHAKLGNYKIYETLDFTLNSDDSNIYKLEREIDFTTSKTLDVYHSDSQMNLSSRRFMFSDSLNTSILSGTWFPSETQITPISYSKEPKYNGPSLWYYLITVVLESSDWNKLKDGYKLYVKKQGETDQELVVSTNYILSDIGGTKVLTQNDWVSVPDEGVFIDETDEIFLKLNEDDDTSLNYPEHWLDKWKRYGVDESVRFIEGLSKMYVDMAAKHSFVFNGSLTRLVGPLDLVEFSYKGDKQYLPTRLELDLVDYRTSITMIELNHEAIEYNGEDDEILEVVEPNISIESHVSEPGMFEILYKIVTHYTIVGFDTAQATISAKQLSDSPQNSGVPTGFEKTEVITNFQGASTLHLTLEEAPVYFGWYEVQVDQGGVSSNVEYVFVDSEVVAPPAEFITITEGQDLDFLNRQVEYSVVFTGFTPSGDVTQRLQKIDQITQMPIGNAIETTIADHTEMQSIDFTTGGLSGGTWRLTVLADGKESNNLGWFVYTGF